MTRRVFTVKLKGELVVEVKARDADEAEVMLNGVFNKGRSADPLQGVNVIGVPTRGAVFDIHVQGFACDTEETEAKEK